MALDQEYFDSIHIEVAKKKYYNANKVEAVLADIRRRAEELNAENERLRRELAERGDRREELGDTILSAQTIYRDIVEKANARADRILSEAEERRARLEEEIRQQEEASVQRVQKIVEIMKQQHLDAIESINGAWQEFLCELYPPEAEETAQAAAPDDLDRKIDAIARQLRDWDK